jgi:hypothetical protein
MDRKQNYRRIHQLLVLFYFSPLVHLPLLERSNYGGGLMQMQSELI